jgi:hypothetical protein
MPNVRNEESHFLVDSFSVDIQIEEVCDHPL